jgi:hypothetical protein
MRYFEILNENETSLSDKAHQTRRFDFKQIKNRRFMFNAKTGRFILGDEGTAGTKTLSASHAEEYFEVTGSNAGYDSWIRGWVGVGGRYRNGVIHFAPPIDGMGPKSDDAFQCIKAFMSNGATEKTKIRGLKMPHFGYMDEPTVKELMASLTEGEETLEEMPIANFQKVGNWDKNSSYKDNERKLLNNPKAVEKIKAKWAKTPHNYNMYFVNSPEANRNSEIGMVDQEWLEQNMPKALSEFQYQPNAINILFNSNKGDEKVPMTAWIIAHRFGHAISRYGKYNFTTGQSQRQVYHFTEVRNIIFRYMNNILENYGVKVGNSEERHNNSGRYGEHQKKANTDKILKYFFQNIGTMRSAREAALRNEFEFTLELLAQYMLTGKIKFNPLPKHFKAGQNGYYSFRGNEHDYEYYNNALTDMAEELEDNFNAALNECEGKIFVM